MTDINAVRELTTIAKALSDEKKELERAQERAEIRASTINFCETVVENLILKTAANGSHCTALPDFYSYRVRYKKFDDIMVHYPLYVDTHYANGKESEHPDYSAAPLSLKLLQTYLQERGYTVTLNPYGFMEYGLGKCTGFYVTIKW